MTLEEALRIYARMANTLNADLIEPILSEDFHYASQYVYDELQSKAEFLEYIRKKLKAVAESNLPVFAEMGSVFAYGKQQPCVVIAQGTRDNLVGLVLGKMENGLLKRLDMCIVPSPNTANRTGEYPS